MGGRGFWRRRSRSRLVLAVICAVAALVAVGVVYIPETWLEQTGAAIQAAGTYLVSFGGRSWLFAVGGILIVCAVLLVLLPRRKKHPYWTTGPSATVPAVSSPSAPALVSVYVDAENQLQKAEIVRPFVTHLRQYLDEHERGQRADLLYFADGSQPAHRPTYDELYRFGFRPIDVPHVSFKDEEVKDAVDMELSLHAFDRAIHGGPQQHFILVTRDRDFIPLIFRLHALGHIISVWAADPPQAFREVPNFLDHIDVFDLNAVFPPNLRSSPAQTNLPKTNTPSRRSQSNKSRSAGRWTKKGSVAVPRRAHKPTIFTSGQRGHVTIAEAIGYTLDVINRLNSSTSADEDRIRLLPKYIDATQGDFLRRLGYIGNTRIDCWITELIALGILRTTASGAPTTEGATDPRVGADQMERFVRYISYVVLGLAAERRGRVVTYLDISKRIEALSLDDAGESDNPLRSLVVLGGPKSRAHTRYLCLCARALDLLNFEEVSAGISIRVKGPATPTSTAPEAAPHADDPTEQGHDAVGGGGGEAVSE